MESRVRTGRCSAKVVSVTNSFVTNNFLRLQARTQRFTLGVPREFRIAPDGSRVLFVRSASGTERRHSLWSRDVASGQESEVIDPAALLDVDENLPPEEKARRERSRNQAAGIVGYSTDEHCRMAAFTLSGRLFVTDLASAEVRELATASPVFDPQLDPTGQRVAYVHGGAVRVVDVDGSADHALVEPESSDITWGLAEFVAAEEMSRLHGFWWSPSGTQLLAARVDQSGMNQWHIADPANPERPVTTVAYPAAGTPNAAVSLAVLGLDGSRTPVDWSDDEYLAVVRWTRSGPPLIAAQSRDQRRMRVLSIDPETGATTVRQELVNQHWVDLVGGMPTWTPDGRVVTVAPVEGAYRVLLDGRPISGPDLQVRAVLDVSDEDVLCTASAEDPTQVHVYAVGLDGETHRVSDVDGVHGATRRGGVTVLVSSTLDQGGPIASVLVDGKAVGRFASLAEAPPLTPKVTMLTVGDRELRCALLFPTGYRRGSTRLPVLLDPYGGPHAQRVLHARRAYLESQWLADQGFAVLVADGRGTPGRGPAWEREVHHNFADATLTDQIDALQAVAARYPDLDTDKVGIRGWSYGGYLAALAVLRRPDAVHAAVAGAPVTDWRLYDTHYTERYLGHPAEQPEVYERNSLLADAPGLRQPLMLIHGLADDNVFAAHTLRLSAALLAHGRAHTVLPMTGVTHMSPSAEAEAENLMLLQLDWLKQALGVAAAGWS